MKLTLIKHAVILSAIATLAGCASTTSPGAVDVDRKQLLLVPAAQLEQMAQQSFNEQNAQARAAGKLVTQGAQYQRVKRIAARLQKQAPIFRPDAARWNWEVALINSPELNASVAPGGKITVYTGLIESLKLTDDEIAMVLGHEIAHALREHGREKVSQAMAQNLIGSVVLGALGTSEAQAQMAGQVTNVMLTLPNSRKNEIEADKIGLEIAARAGFNPAAAMSVWQKMGAASNGASPPEFLSTHPANASRIAELSRLQTAVQPLYHAAPKQ